MLCGQIDLHIGIAVIRTVMAFRLQQISGFPAGAFAVADNFHQSIHFRFFIDHPAIIAVFDRDRFPV